MILVQGLRPPPGGARPIAPGDVGPYPDWLRHLKKAPVEGEEKKR